MTKWGLLKPLLPWLCWWLAGAAALVFAAGFVVSDWRDQGTIERLRGAVKEERAECDRDKAAAERAARLYIEAEQDKWASVARRERSRAEALGMMLREAQARAAKQREEFNHALADSDLGRCDARKPARLLRDKAERYARDLAGAAAPAGGVHGPARTRAGDGRQRPRDGGDGLSLRRRPAGLGPRPGAAADGPAGSGEGARR